MPLLGARTPGSYLWLPLHSPRWLFKLQLSHYIVARGRRKVEETFSFKDILDVPWITSVYTLLDKILSHGHIKLQRSEETQSSSGQRWAPLKTKDSTKKGKEKRYWEKAFWPQRAFLFVVFHG